MSSKYLQQSIPQEGIDVRCHDLHVDGVFQADSQLIVDGNLNVGGKLDVVGNADIHGDGTVDGDLNVLTDLDVVGNADVHGNGTVDGNLSVNGLSVTPTAVSHFTTWSVVTDGTAVSSSVPCAAKHAAGISYISSGFTITMPAAGVHNQIVNDSPFPSQFTTTGYCGFISGNDGTNDVLIRVEGSGTGLFRYSLYVPGSPAVQPFVNSATYTFVYHTFCCI